MVLIFANYVNYGGSWVWRCTLYMYFSCCKETKLTTRGSYLVVSDCIKFTLMCSSNRMNWYQYALAAEMHLGRLASRDLSVSVCTARVYNLLPGCVFDLKLMNVFSINWSVVMTKKKKMSENSDFWSKFSNWSTNSPEHFQFARLQILTLEELRMAFCWTINWKPNNQNGCQFLLIK